MTNAWDLSKRLIHHSYDEQLRRAAEDLGEMHVPLPVIEWILETMKREFDEQAWDTLRAIRASSN